MAKTEKREYEIILKYKDGKVYVMRQPKNYAIIDGKIENIF
jgi:hypothetical protein